MPSYLACKALAGLCIPGTDVLLATNPNCVCFSFPAAFGCPTGHMLECHYPLSCDEAGCDHLARYGVHGDRLAEARIQGHRRAHQLNIPHHSTCEEEEGLHA